VSLLLALAVVLGQAVPAAPATPPSPVSQNATPAAPTPQNATPGKPAIVATPDPASAHFTSELGILLVAIKPTAVADYELVISTLQEMLAKDTDPIRSAAAQGWRVWKASEADAKNNVLYVHVMMPATPNFDYRPSLLLDELVDDLAPELLSRYQEAFAMPPSKLNLIEFAKMSVAPLQPETKPDPTKKPGGH